MSSRVKDKSSSFYNTNRTHHNQGISPRDGFTTDTRRNQGRECKKIVIDTYPTSVINTRDAQEMTLDIEDKMNEKNLTE